MPLVCHTVNIKFTLITDLDEEQIAEGLAEANNYENTVGYIKNGKFTYPDGSAEEDVNHWTVEFCKAFPDIELIWIIKGNPTNVDMDLALANRRSGNRDWYENQHRDYGLWSTPVGYVAVC